MRLVLIGDGESPHLLKWARALAPRVELWAASSRGFSPEFEALLASQTALGRVGEPADVARVIASLLTDDGRWINAQTIEVAGGYVI